MGPLKTNAIKLLYSIPSVGGVVLAACMITILFFQVCSRYFAGYSPVWASEIAQIQFVWLCFMGFALALQRSQHVSLDYMLARAPARVRTLLAATSELFMLGFAIIVGYGGVVLVDQLSSSVTSGMGISVGWVYAAPIVAGGLMAAFSLARLLGLIRRSSQNVPR